MPPKTKLPVYRGLLNRPLTRTGAIVADIDARLAAACKVFSIDQAKPAWERQLLMAVLGRHVPGFGLNEKSGRKPTVDNSLIIEAIEFNLNEAKKSKKGKVLLKSVIYDIVEDANNVGPQHPCYGTSATRLTKIYGERKQHATTQRARHTQNSVDLKDVADMLKAVSATPVDSHSRLVLAVHRARHGR